MFLYNRIINGQWKQNKIGHIISAFCSSGNKLRSDHTDEGRQVLLLLRIKMNVWMEPAASDHGLKSDGKKLVGITKFYGEQNASNSNC